LAVVLPYYREVLLLRCSLYLAGNEVLNGAGGAIRAAPFAIVDLDACTISDNRVHGVSSPESDGGGGILIGSTSIGDSVLTIDNSIIYGNHAALGPDLRQAAWSEPYTFTYVNNSCIGEMNAYLTSSNSTVDFLTSSNNLIRSDPQFADPDNGDYHLLYGSPCIDSGSPTYSGSFRGYGWGTASFRGGTGYGGG
jgi:hypothetical protein